MKTDRYKIPTNICEILKGHKQGDSFFYEN